MSGLRYFLKAGAKLDRQEMLDDLIAIIPKRPSLIYLVCRYLGFYLSDIDDDFFNTKEKFIHAEYEKVWRTYCENSLTEWTKFWLLKVLSAPKFAKEHGGFQTELNRIVADPNTKFLRPLAFFYKGYLRDLIRWDKAVKGDILNEVTGFYIGRHKATNKKFKNGSRKSNLLLLCNLFKGC